MPAVQRRKKALTFKFNYLQQTVAAAVSLSPRVPEGTDITLHDFLAEGPLPFLLPLVSLILTFLVRRNAENVGIENGSKMVSSVKDQAFRVTGRRILDILDSNNTSRPGSRIADVVGEGHRDEKERILASFPIIKRALDSMNMSAATRRLSPPPSSFPPVALSASAVEVGSAQQETPGSACDNDSRKSEDAGGLVDETANYEPIAYEGDAQRYQEQIFARIEAWQRRADLEAACAQQRMDDFLDRLLSE
ncbi:hypothetical protein C8F04DRAFT_1261128 [Mycena alexandri]|uniref:Uncharacterized protein n=1 Tax=Mycena alexandri TaxID=1745969 RepID=A0AAD6STC4_9AGAR|nr:hypothetical protein C8F04DRAFT_1261128 [Mycena alexandri]